MKILDAPAMRQLDARTMEHEPVRSLDLMERAAKSCFQWLRPRLRNHEVIHVFCGMGNNGGDGLALARMLGGSGKKVRAYLVRHASGEGSADFQANLKRLRPVRNVHIDWLEGKDSLPPAEAGDVIVDALLGSGLSRPLEGFLAEVVRHINASGAVVVSIDLPSGLFSEDNRENDPSRIVHADFTLSFQLPKLAFLMAENAPLVGEWHLMDIGLHPVGMEEAATRYFFLDKETVRGFYRPRKKFAHKGHFGHALLMAGSHGKVGAAILAAKACLRSGAGLLTVQVPGCGYAVVQGALPEAMCLEDGDREKLTTLPPLDPYNAVGIGPGIGTDAQTARTLKLLIQQSAGPLVLDADALNILADNPTWCGFLPSGCVITPHPGEFDRLAGKAGSDYQRLLNACDFARRFGLIVVLKGAHTAIISPEGPVYFNSTGNPGMATGGSGDALTGMILGWIAQGYAPLPACLMGVFLHGLAGDMAAAGKGQEGLLAGDLLDMIPRAQRKVLQA